MPIEHISDTARWVAVYRAMETARPDAIFRDPYARRLAGDRGDDIVDTMKQGRAMAWAMIVRTAVFDEIILDTIARHGVDTIVNLAAGLDARPWRLDLPASLRWIDVDLPAILGYKTEALRDETPRCRYESVATDLTDDVARRALFARIGAESKRVFVVTEGLLIYLTEPQVASLAADLHAQPNVSFWLIDLASPRLLKIMQRTWGKSVAKGNAPFRFAPAVGTDFFTPLGWMAAQFRSTMEEAHRLRREMRGMWFWRVVGRLYPKRTQEEFRRMSGVVLLERA
ncbi:MAG: SAM-dependent methyltransferase [Gemmatimonadaceae bacterium]|nr:SAM-dependent methyltransferase [Gemmatimonadaceae bacterium]